MTTPDPWSDVRLGAAFAAFAVPTPNLADSLASTMARLRQRSATAPAWRRLLPAAAVIAVAIGGLTGGVALLGGTGGTGLVEFRDGPTADLRTLDAGEWAFDFPADWLAYDAAAAGSGGSSIAVLGTQRVEPRCGDEGHIDINCVYEQPLGPGDVRLFVGTGAYRGGTVLDRPDIENGTTTRLTVGGMPAILDELDPLSGSLYREDLSLAWAIGQPRSLTNVVRIEVRVRDPGSTDARSVVQALIDSFRFTPPPTPLPSDPAAAVEAARTAIRSEAEAFRRGYGGDVDTTAETYLECLGNEPVTASRASVRYGPGGDLGQLVDLACTWIVREETPAIWRLDLTYEWSADGRSGRYVETLWLDAAASVIASTFAGDPPPAASAGPSVPASVLGLQVTNVSEALAVRDAGVDDRELAVRGWFSPIPPIVCPAPATWPVSPVEPNCPDQWVVLMAEPQSLTTVEQNGFSGRLPAGAFFQLDLDDIDAGWQPRLPEAGPAEPVEIVVIGHFDDRRSRLCPEDVEDACRDRFAVDRVAWVEGETPPPSRVSLLDGVAARSSVGEILAIIAAETPDSAVLSVVTVDGPLGLRSVEPSLGTGRRGLIDQPVLWVVRVLESGRLATYIVVDGSDAIYEMTEDGDALPVGGSLGPPASVAPWPPAGSVVIELTSQVRAGSPPIQVVVVDLSGRLVGAAEQGSLELAAAMGEARVSAYPEPGRPGRVHLFWGGGICDSRIVVTVAADLRSIRLDNGFRPPCDAIGVLRAVVMDFSGSVDVPAIEVYRSVTLTGG